MNVVVSSVVVGEHLKGVVGDAEPAVVVDDLEGGEREEDDALLDVQAGDSDS